MTMFYRVSDTDKQQYVDYIYDLYISGKTYREIGKMLNKDRTTIMYHCRKRKKELQDKYKEQIRYDHIINRPINRGKKDYAAYLNDEWLLFLKEKGMKDYRK